MAAMKALQVTQYLSHRDLTVSSVARPAPAPGHVLVRISCCAANFFDLLQVRGKYQTQPAFPWIAGYEFSGTVVESRDSRFVPGDTVFGGGQGAFAEFISVPASQLIPAPRGIPLLDLSTLFITAPTSYLAIFHRAKLLPGEICLVHAGAGGVGLMAVQMAKAAGALVIATASTREKLDICLKFGADVAINYTDADWIAQVKKATKGKGCNVVYDPVGMVEQSLKVVAWNARILIVGFAAGQIEKVAMNKALLKQTSLMGVFWGGTTINEPQLVAKVWKGILGLLESGKLRATVFDKVYTGLESVPSALEALGSRGTWGKVVIQVEGAASKL